LQSTFQAADGRTERSNDKRGTITHDEWTVPTNLKDEDGWHNFVVESDDKIPIAPYKNDWPGQPVDAQDSDNTTSFLRALLGWKFDEYGLGFVLPNRDEYPEATGVLIDGDDVVNRDDDGALHVHPFFYDLLRRAGSFADVSWSFNGAHIMGIAPDGLPDGIAKIDAPLPEHQDFPNASIEVYDGGRFVAMSGRHIDGTPTEARNVQSIVDKLAERFGPESSSDEDDRSSDDDVVVSRSEIPEKTKEYARSQDLALDGRDEDEVAAIWTDIQNFFGEFETTNRARHYLTDLFNGEAKKWGYIDDNGRLDRSKSLVSLFGKVHRIVLYGDGDPNYVAHFIDAVCEARDETEDGQPRKWDERGKKWRRGLVMSALHHHDDDAFVRWQRRKFEPGEDPDITDRTRRDRKNEPADLTYDYARNAAITLCEKEPRNYPNADVVASLATRADPSRSLSYYKQVVSKLVNEKAHLKKARFGRYDNRYYPRNYPDPSAADAIELGRVDVTGLDPEQYPERKSVAWMTNVRDDVNEATR